MSFELHRIRSIAFVAGIALEHRNVSFIAFISSQRRIRRIEPG